MRTFILVSLLFGALSAEAQQLNLQSLDKLADRAKEKTVVDLDSSAMQLASGFLSDADKQEAAAKKTSADIKGIHVRVFEFAKDRAYSEADLKPLRDQLSRPGWKRIVTIQEGDDKEDVGIWIFTEGDTTKGMAIIVASADELVVVNFLGSIRPQDLANIGGQFGIPPIEGLKKE